jgi:MFS family permease
VLVATSLAAFTATLDNTVVAVALRDLQRDLDAGVAELQGVVTAYTVALAALLLTGGTLADVAGRRRVLVSGLAVFAAASAGCALSDTSTELIAWRAVQGAGAALVLPGSLAVLAAAHPEPAARARAVGLWAATGAAALLAGPLVGGLLVEASGWPAVFWVNLPLCAAVALVTALAPAGPPAASGRRLDLPGQVLVAVGLAAGTYAVVLAGRDGLRWPVLASLLLAAASLVAFAVVERRAPDPVLPLGLLRRPTVHRSRPRGVRGQPRGLRAAGVPVAVPAAGAAARRAARRGAAAAADGRPRGGGARSRDGGRRGASARRSWPACWSPPRGSRSSRCGCGTTSATSSWPSCSASAASASVCRRPRSSRRRSTR